MKIVCIPAYNEEQLIGDVVKKSLKYSKINHYNQFI